MMTFFRRGFASLLALAVAVGTTAAVRVVTAQTITAASPRFEVTSVKPSTAVDRQIMMVLRPGGRFTSRNIPLRLLIRTAYQLQDDQIVDAPDWVRTDRFDILATAGGAPEMREAVELLKSLLADRFKLRVHTDRRALPVYNLVRGDKSDVAPGFKPTECPPPEDDLRQAQPCASISNPPGRLILRGMPVAQFQAFLSPVVNRVVVDRTGLDGRYDIDLRFTPDRPPAASGSAAPDRAAAADPDVPTIFTAMQEQLGLKLESGRAVVDVLVVDDVNRPEPD
jgi:uncharacterized protein (TIGR03435 family)